MATNNAIDEAYLQSLANQQSTVLDKVLSEQTESLDQLVNRKKEELGLKSEEKTNDFISQNINIDDITDADTLRNFGRLYGGGKGFSLDAYETAKYDENNELIPYLGSIEPTDGSKRSKKWDLHRISYAKRNGIKDYTMVSQRMLNEEAAKQTEEFKRLLLEGQNTSSGQIAVDIRQDGEGYYGRPLITVRNPETGKIINEVMNTPKTNAMFYSQYNVDSYIDGVQKLEEATRSFNEKTYSGEGFWISAGKGLSQGIDGLQATGWGMAALIADSIPGKRGEATATWFIEQYLRNLEEAQANGAQLPKVEDVDWSNPNEALSKFGALLGEAMPSIALMIGTGGLGGLVAKQAISAGVKGALKNTTSSKFRNWMTKTLIPSVQTGRAAGAYLGATGLETGSIYGDVAAAGKRDSRARLGSLAGGTIAGALEAFYPIKLMRKLGMGKAAKSQTNSSLNKVLKNNLGDNAKGIAAGILTGGSQEGTTEFLQFIVEEVTQDLIKEGHLPDMNSAEFRSGLLNSFVAGLVPGSTLSGGANLINEVQNRLAGDQGATARAYQNIQRQVQEATNQEATGGKDQKSEEILVDTVSDIEKVSQDLGVTLPDDYAKKVPIEKAVFLADALNRLEIQQKDSSGGTADSNVINAKNTINEALDQLNTGEVQIDIKQRAKRIDDSAQARIDRINARTEQRINETTPSGKPKSAKAIKTIKDKAAVQIANIEKARDNAINRLGSKKRAAKKGSAPARSSIVSAAKRIRAINKILNNKQSNLSKAKRKELNRERNQLGVLINNLTKKNEVNLTKGVIKAGQDAIGSFKFQKKVTQTQTNEELSDLIDVAQAAYDDYINTKEDNLSVKDREEKKSNLLGAYSEINKAIKELQKDKKETTDKEALKEIDVKLSGFVQLRENIVSELNKLNKEETKKQETTTEQDTDSLDIDILNEGVDNATLGSLQGAQKEQAERKNKVRDSFRAIKKRLKNAKKTLLDVHDEITNGRKGKFKGLETYLENAKNNVFEETQFDDFVLGLELKYKAWQKAKAIFNRKKNKTDVYVDKNTYKVYSSRKQLPDSDLNNYWYINDKSDVLIELLELEIEYAKNIKAVIADVLNNVDSKVKNKELNDTIIANQKKIDEIIAKNQEDTGSLDDIKKPKAKPKSKPKAKPKKEAKDSDSATAQEIEDIILEAEEIIDEDVSTDELANPKEQTRANRNKRLKAYQTRVINLIKKLSAERDTLKDILKNKKPFNRVEIQDKVDALNYKIANHKLELKNFIAAELRQKSANHFLTKFANTFVKLRDTVLSVTDLFRIKDIERDSFFSFNQNKNLDEKSIKLLLEKVKVDPESDYGKALVSQFIEFKKAFNSINSGLNKTDLANGLLAKQAFKLFSDKDGNLPDEVIFAMMLSTMHYAAVNVGHSKFRAMFEIADLLYGDAKQTDRLGKEEIAIWGNAGIFTRNASKDIGLEMFDLLNVKFEKDSEKEFLKNIAKIEEDSSFRGVVIRDSNFRNVASTSLGLLAIQTARKVNSNGKKDKGLFRLRRGSYPIKHFDNPNLAYINELQEDGEQFIQWNTIQINDSDLLKLFKDNTDELQKIKGADSNIKDISFSVPKNVQERTDNSFFKLGKKVKNLIKKLQNVEWIGKESELDLFISLMNLDKNGNLIKDEEGNLIINDALKELIGYKELSEQHSENREAVDSANKEKLKDIEYIFDYYNNREKGGLRGFYFRYKAQSQHRLRIDSNTINPQRSKIMRALFNPVNSESKIETDSDRAMFKLGVVQAFGYNIKTLEEGINIFNAINQNEAVKNAINATPENFSNALTELMKEGIVDGASTHLIEAVIALKNYDDKEAFTTTLGVETDGITNGYAIGLLQFLDGTPEELKEALERIGVFVDQKDAINTYEKFIASGKDDVYQAFSRKIVEAIQELSVIESNAVNALHGQLLEKDGSLSKFARDLAKNPVMISNYGAGVEKVINAVIGKIVPDLYDTLAKHQTAYNKATNKAERDAVMDEISTIKAALLASTGIDINFAEKLANNKLYDFKFSPKRKAKIENYFRSIYANEETKLFKNALETLLKPIKESREILVKIVEAEFFIFYSEFQKRTSEFPKGSLTNSAIRMHIAAELADDLMPRMNSPWSENEGELLQLIKQIDTIGTRVEVQTEKFNNVIWDKSSRKFKFIKSESEARIGSNTGTTDLAEPGVSAVINMIQNMDSVVLGDLLEQKQQVLPIYDAVISPIKDAISNAQKYNESFIKRNIEHVMLEETLAQYKKVVTNASKYGIDLKIIDKQLKTESFRGKQIVKELTELNEDIEKIQIDIDKLKNKKKLTQKQENFLRIQRLRLDTLLENKVNLEEEQATLTIKGLEEVLEDKILQRQTNLEALIEKYGDIDTWVISQMFLPESLVDPKSKPKREVKPTRPPVRVGLRGTNLSEEVIDGFKGAKDAAIQLSKSKNQTAYVRKIAKLLIPLLSDTTVVSYDFERYGRSSEAVDGTERSYHHTSGQPMRPNVILIEPKAGSTVLLHELIHAASQRILKTDAKDRTLRQNNAVKKMWKVREAIKKEYERDMGLDGKPARGDITGEEENSIKYLIYGGIENWDISQINARKRMSKAFGNPEGLRDSEALAEFLTQTLTSAYAQQYLKRKKITNKSVWTRLVETVRDLLGIKDDSLLDEALSISIEGIEALKEDDQRSQVDLFDNEDKIDEIKVDEIIADAKRKEKENKEADDTSFIDVDILSQIENDSRYQDLVDKDKKLVKDLLVVKAQLIDKINELGVDIVFGLSDPSQVEQERKQLQKELKENTKNIESILDNKEEDDFLFTEHLNSIDNIVDNDLKEIYKTNSLRENLQSIFETLGLSGRDSYLNKGDQQRQEGHLQRVLTEIISEAGIILDDTTLTLNESTIKAHGEANIGESSVTVNFNKFRPETHSEQTAQEVYVHELLHILTRFALTKDSRIKEKVERIRNEVKAELEKSDKPYELFLRKDAEGNIIYLTDKQLEIEAAQAQYNYLFGDAVPADAVLDEFLAYSLSNKFMVEKLNTMDSQVIPLWSKDENTTVVEKLVQFFTEILDRIRGVLSGKTKPLNLEEQIFELAKDIVVVNQSKRDELARALKLNKAAGVIDSGNEAIRKFANDVAIGAIKKGSDAYIAAIDKLTKNGKVKGFFADVLYDSKLIAYFGSSYKDFVDNHPAVQEKLNVIFRNFKPNTLKNLSSLKSDLFGGVNQDFIKLLYRSHNEIDSNRRQYKELTKESLQKVFKDYDSLTNIEKESLTKVFLKTDLSTLVASGEFTTEEVIELIKDNSVLDDLILKYRKQLKINKNSHYRLQTSQLAKYMITGKNKSYNQMLNAANIYQHGSKKKRTYSKEEADNEIRDLDIYISLLALRDQNLLNAKNEVNAVIQREFDADPTHNGIHGLINLHISFKAESLKDGFDNNPSLMTKGYIATITDPDTQIVIEPDDPATNAEMERRGYTFISKVDGVGAEPWSLWIVKNNPELTRTKGIISMTSKQFKGTSLKEIFSRNQTTKRGIMDALNKFNRQQTKRANKGMLSQKYTAIPVVDGFGRIVDYRITINHALSEKHLQQELSFDEVLPTMFSQLQDKIKSEQINKEAIKLLYTYGKENRETNPSKFINILDARYSDEYYQPLPKQAKFEIENFATINKKTRKPEFWVERGYLDTVFGYVNPSVANISFFNNKPKTQRYVKVTEKLVKEMVSLAVVNVVIKIPIVPAVNFASNFVTSMLYGVPPTYLIKKWREGILELNNYKQDAKELKLLDIEILSNPALENDAKTQKKREILVKKINKNPVSGFVDAGLFTSITEDINQNEFTYRNKSFNKLKEKGNKLISGKLFDVANHAYLGEHTAIFKASMHFLQMSDFIARYALYKHQVEVKGIDKDKAWKTMVETFVNYDQPLNRFVAYGNDMGAILFVKYWLRIQRAGINLIKEKPLNVGLLWASTGLLNMDIETILDSSLLTGNFMPTLGGFEKIFEEVVIPPGLEILAGEGFS